MRLFGTGFPVVAARAGLELPTPADYRRASRQVPCSPAPAAAIVPAATASAAPEASGPVSTDASPAPLERVGAGVGPGLCPVCGLVVAAEYAARTGSGRHRPCLTDPDRMRRLTRPHSTRRAMPRTRTATRTGARA